MATVDALRPRDRDSVGQYEQHTVWALVAVTLVDRLVTLSHWHLEANPLTTALGPSAWLLFTAILLTALIGVWYCTEAYRVRVAHWVVGCMTLVTGVVVIGNVAVLGVL